MATWNLAKQPLFEDKRYWLHTSRRIRVQHTFKSYIHGQESVLYINNSIAMLEILYVRSFHQFLVASEPSRIFVPQGLITYVSKLGWRVSLHPSCDTIKVSTSTELI
ncbi:hypothetical protein ACJQWK_02439 [Exserohilum turcicum]